MHNSKCARNLVARIPLVVLAITFLFTSAWGQLNQGSIAGNVFDTSGAVVAGAKLSAKNTETGAVYATESSSAGAYRFPNVNIGTYNVTAAASSFKTSTLTGVVVQVGTASALTITLQSGGVTETVLVNAETPTIQTESSDIGTVVTSKQVLDLPLALGSVVQAMRSPEAFVFLSPGAIGPGTASGNGGTFESKISGGQAYSTEVLLDGASTYRSENGSSFDETAPSVDALSEFKLTTSTMPAEMGRTTGGVESFSTKAGTNRYHGSAYDIFRNEYLNANSFFNNHIKAKRVLDRQNDYGLTLGGPVQIPHLYNGRDKTFFFFSWEQYRETQGGVSNRTVPTALQRIGDFSETLGAGLVDNQNPPQPIFNPCDGTQLRAGQIFDPATTQTVGGVQCRTAFPGNVIPQNRLSTVAQNILAFYPTPQNGNLVNNYAFPYSFPILDTTMTVRADQSLGTKSKVYFTYSSRDNHRIATNPIFANPAGEGRTQDFFTHYIRGGWDYSITPSLLNHLNVGYNRTNSLNLAVGTRSGVNWAQKLGIGGTPAVKGGTPFPAINIADNTVSIGDDVVGDNIDNGFRFNDSVEHFQGKHDLKFGVDLRYQQNSPLGFGRTTGLYSFGRGQTSGTNLETVATGNGLASLLLGQPQDANLNDYTSQPRYVAKYYALFFQDSFKIKPNFTINYGLRWDVDVPRYEVHGNTSNIDLKAPNSGANGFPGALVFAGKGTGRNGNVHEQWAKTWHKDFGPRIGFSWAPGFGHDKTVIRGGFGILYGALLYADFGGFNRVGFTGNPAFFSPDGQGPAGFNPAFKLDSGFPAYTPPPNFDPAQLNYQGPQYVDPSFGRPATVNNWSLELQHELASDLIMDIAYVGQHSTHLHTNFNATNSLNAKYLSLGTLLNQSISSPAAAAAGISAPYASFPSNFSVAQALVPHPQYFGFNTDGTLENYGQSSYNALQVSLRRRFRNGLNLLASYSWTKTLTDADDALPFFATLHGGGSAQNPFNKKGEKAISNQDVPHTLVLSYVYDLPFGHGKKFLSGGGVKDRIVGGWSISGIHRYQSGQPISFAAAAIGAPAFAGGFRFDRVKGQPLFSQVYQSGHFDPFKDSIFNSAAFTDPNAACGTPAGCSAYVFGNVPRTTGEVRMGHYLHEDFNILKRTRITESTDILLQFSMLNAFNRHIFNRPGDLNPNDGIFFARIDPSNTLDPPRKLQLQLKFEF